MGALLELAQGGVVTAVDQLHVELPTGPRPGLVRLPDVGVGLGGGVLRQTAAARRHRGAAWPGAVASQLMDCDRGSAGICA